MWEVDNRTPFAALGYFLRDRAGTEHWVTAIRARFDMLPESLNRVAEDQGEIRIEPEYRDGDAQELLVETDFAPFRPMTDILLTGTAKAAFGSSVNKVEAGFDLAGVSKRSTVFGERRLRVKNGKPTLDGYESFAERELSWAHSLGGVDLADPALVPHPSNPIGMGWFSKQDNLQDGLDIRLPYFENPSASIGPGQMPPPIGFGALSPSWSPRLALAGTYDDNWRKYEAPLPPSDFAESFYQTAPQDQVRSLKGGESGRIFGLSDDGEFVFRLPQIVLECSTWMGTKKIDTRPHLICVLLNGTEKTLELTWNAAIPCPHGDMSVSRSRVWVRQMAGVTR